MRRLLVITCFLSAGRVPAQIPERFENLEFFPADVARDTLLATMRGFSFALGVRCVYCHVGEDSPTLAGVDFKSDEKRTKRTAREMLRMVADINGRSLAALPERSDPVAVRCATCHRGIPRPIPLEDTLYRIAAGGDGRKSVAAYDSLRATYYGRASFDFGPMPLVRLAERFFADKRHEDAIVVLRKNAEVNPRFWNTYWELGRNHEALGQTADAIEAYRTVLQRLPNHPGATVRLRALEGGAGTAW